MRFKWNGHAAWGGYFGVAIGLFALMGGGLLTFIIPGTGLADLIAPRSGVGYVLSVLLSNALACSLIWSGVRASGRWRWWARAGAVVLYGGLVALTLSRFKVGI